MRLRASSKSSLFKRRSYRSERKQLADEKAARESVGSSALAFVEALNADDDDAAEAAVLKINLDELTPLEVAMLKTDLESFRDDRANEHYRVGRDMLARTRRPDAVKSFESALSMSGDFRYSDSARYLLGTTLRELGEYDRAIAVFREIEELETRHKCPRGGSILAGLFASPRRTKRPGHRSL